MSNHMIERISYISYLRSFSMLLIILCHLATVAPSNYIHMTSQFFNVGVEVFFFLISVFFGMRMILE